MIDFHVHCDYSSDAHGSAREYAGWAVRNGLRTICFTTHCDLDPERRHHDGKVRLNGEIVDVTSDWLGHYVQDVKKVAREYADGGLQVLLGLEIGYTPGIENLIGPVVDSFEFDYILGGVHTLEGIDIVSSTESKEYFAAHSPRELCQAYYRDLGEAVATGLFDCIAHIDIYKRIGSDFYGEELNRAHQGLVEPVLEAIAGAGISLEINSGGLRKGLPWPYPSLDILEAARRAGVEDITPGSDCHRPEEVGYRIDDCLAAAGQAGYGKVAVFAGRKKRHVAIADVRTSGDSAGGAGAGGVKAGGPNSSGDSAGDKGGE